MRLRQVSFLTVWFFLFQAVTAFAGYVFVTPPQSSLDTTVRGYTEGLIPIGTVQVPGNVIQALASVNGAKAIFLTDNPANPVVFVNIVGDQFSGAVRSVTLGGRVPLRAELSPNGQFLFVIAQGEPGALFTIDLIGETLVGAGPTILPQQPKDFAISPDGLYGYFIGANFLYFVVDMGSQVTVFQQGLIGELDNVSVSPTGRVFVTSIYQLLEYNPKPPHSRIGFTQLSAVAPGKFSFSPDGRYALAANLLAGIVNGPSVHLFDLSQPGSNNVNQPPSAKLLDNLAVTLPDTAGTLRVQNLTISSPDRAYAWHANSGRIVQISYPVLAAAEAVASTVGPFGVVSSFTASEQYPNRANLYYGQGNLVRQVTLPGNQLGQVQSAVDTVRAVHFAAVPSQGAAGELIGIGAGQIVGPGVELMPYAVRVLDPNGVPIEGRAVQFTASAPEVGLSTNTAITNKDGIVLVTVVSPLANGDFSVTASVGDKSVVLTSRVTGGDTPPSGPGGPQTARIIKVRGDGTLRQIFDGFDIERKPMVVRILDAQDKPIAGVPIAWTYSNEVAPIFAATETDENGEAIFQWVPGGTSVVGQPLVFYSITATSAFGSVTFSATGFPQGNADVYPLVNLVKPTQENPDLTVRLGEVLKNAIQVRVVTGTGPTVIGGTPIKDIGVRVFSPFTNPAEGPVVQCQQGSALTDDTGLATCDILALGKTGEVNLTVEVGGGYAFFERIPLTVLPGNPSTPLILSGNQQNALTGDLFGLPLVGRIRDAAGNNLIGIPVTWEVVTAGTLFLENTNSLSDINGVVSTRVRAGEVAGTHRVRLRAGAFEVLFELTVNSRLGGIVKISGDNQTGIAINQPFPQPLVVRLTNTQGQAVVGQTVNWAVVSGSATLSAGTSASDASGHARINVTAGPRAGNIVVSATAGSLPPVTFTLASRLPGPVITAASFRNAASNDEGIAPGALVRITGPGVAAGVTGVRNASLLGGRLPFEFEGVKVRFVSDGGAESWAPIYQVANVAGVESVLIQVPFEVTGSKAESTVFVQGGSSTVENIVVKAVSPGVLEDDFGNGRIAAVVIRSDGLVVTPETPARRGETLRMYAIGLGQTTPLADTNRVGQPDQVVKATVAVGIDDAGVEVVSAKLAENLIGIYEIVFVVPATASFGNDRPLGFVMEVVPGQPIYANGSIIAIGQQ